MVKYNCVIFIKYFRLRFPKYYKQLSFAEAKPKDIKPVPAKEDQLYVQHGQEAMRKALSVLEEKEGWKLEVAEVTSN